MKKQIALFSIMGMTILLLTMCGKEKITINQVPQLPSTHYDYETIEFGGGLADTPFASNVLNSYNVTDEGATLGRVLFYDTKLSLNNSVSCGTCHHQSKAFSDGKQFSTGFGGLVTKRNTPGIANLHAQGRFFWDNRTRSLEDLALEPVFNHLEMGMENLEDLIPKLSNNDYYSALFLDAFGSSEITEQGIRIALAQFISAISAYNSKFDYVRSETEQFSELEQEGFDLFFSNRPGACGNCHNGVNLAGYSVSNIGLDLEYEDQGAGENHGNNSFPQNDSGLNGAFKTPGLRNIELTAPYMHDGRYKTLEEVIDHYSNGVKPHPNLDYRLRANFNNSPDILGGNGGVIGPIGNLDENPTPIHQNFSPQEKLALVAFLQTLTDYDYISNPKYSDPFDY